MKVAIGRTCKNMFTWGTASWKPDVVGHKDSSGFHDGRHSNHENHVIY